MPKPAARGVPTGRVASALLGGLLIVGCQSVAPAPALTPEPSPAVSASATAPPAPPTTAEPSPTPSAPRLTPAPGPDGMVRSGVQSSGEYRVNTITAPAAQHDVDVRRYVVRVETSLDVDPDEAAAEIRAILDDPRGWNGTKQIGFELVNDPAQADLVINLEAPPTVDQACVQYGTVGVWSCQTPGALHINIDRWYYGTPVWGELPIAEYRAYMINHELGHYIGLGHVSCRTLGAPSPVMQQQSINLNGCTPNAWPAESGEQRP